MTRKSITHPFLLAVTIVLSSCAQNTLRDRAEQGDASAQMELASFYQHGDERNSQKAFSWYEKAALQGHSDAQNNLGAMYKQGIAVEQNYVLALHWFLKSAERGNAVAQYNLGNLYHQGLGVAQDYSQAMKWYTKSAEQGFSEAQRQLGVMHFEGLGVEVNYKQAYAWTALAAADGDKRAASLRNRAASMLNTDELVLAQRQARNIEKRIKGEML